VGLDVAIGDFFTPKSVGGSEYLTGPIAQQVADEVRGAVADVMIGSMPIQYEGGDFAGQTDMSSPVSSANPFGGINNGRNFSRAGTAVGMALGAPGLSLAGNALGSYMDMNNANGMISAADRQTGFSSPAIGFGGLLSGMANNTPLGWVDIGTPMDQQMRDALAQGAMNMPTNNQLNNQEYDFLSGGGGTIGFDMGVTGNAGSGTGVYAYDPGADYGSSGTGYGPADGGGYGGAGPGYN